VNSDKDVAVRPDTQRGTKTYYLFDGLLLLLGIGWGYTFVLTKYVIEAIPILQFLGTRFLLAGLLLGIFIWPKRKHLLRKAEVIHGAVAGTLLALAYGLQTFGIARTAPGMAGMLTELTTVMTPFFYFVITRRPVRRAAIAGATMAFLGGVLMEWTGHHLDMNTGNILILLCDFAYCSHLLVVDKTVHRLDALWYVVTQLTFAGLLSSAAGFATAPLPTHVSAFQWFGYLFELFIGTLGAYIIQINAQRLTNPTHFAVLTSIEGPSSLFFSWLQWGESLDSVKVVGAAILFAGVTMTELCSIRANVQETAESDNSNRNLQTFQPQLEDAPPHSS
jgi:drug/metabolite transporter (DMT)-like permease